MKHILIIQLCLALGLFDTNQIKKQNSIVILCDGEKYVLPADNIQIKNETGDSKLNTDLMIGGFDVHRKGNPRILDLNLKVSDEKDAGSILLNYSILLEKSNGEGLMCFTGNCSKKLYLKSKKSRKLESLTNKEEYDFKTDFYSLDDLEPGSMHHISIMINFADINSLSIQV